MRTTYRPIGNDWQGQRLEWGARRRTPFKASWDRTLLDLRRELAALGADDVIFQLDMPERDIRLDGFPRRDARPRSPAVIISFQSRFGPLRYQCDTFEGGAEGWQDNVRAIALGLEALRTVDRYGITKRGEQYTGWKALPDGSITRADAEEFLRMHGSRDRAVPLEVCFRIAAKKLHPDIAGPGDPVRKDWNTLMRAKEVLGI